MTREEAATLLKQAVKTEKADLKHGNRMRVTWVLKDKEIATGTFNEKVRAVVVRYGGGTNMFTGDVANELRQFGLKQ